MENVQNIRREKALLWVLDEDNAGAKITEKRVAVVAYLYYKEDVFYYFEKLLSVPQRIPIYIISPIVEIEELAKAFFVKENRQNVEFIYKENRGRDISALLIAASGLFEKYQYICFLHDKRAKNKEDQKDVDFWIESLWTNMIASQSYIENVIYKLESNANIGLLVPPEPVGLVHHVWYRNGWFSNFEITKKLASELQLECNLDENCSPITYGTVFWGKTKALNKLFQKKWKYEDFPDEPLPMDNTISHAVERIIAYVAQDAGYDTATIMTKEYAAKQTLIIQEQMRTTYDFFERITGVQSVADVIRIEQNWDKLLDYIQANKNIYIYGTGKVGIECFKILKIMCAEPKGFLVSQYDMDCREIEGVPITEIDKFKEDMDAGIIVATSEKFQKEIVQLLYDSGYKNLFIF